MTGKEKSDLIWYGRMQELVDTYNHSHNYKFDLTQMFGYWYGRYTADVNLFIRFNRTQSNVNDFVDTVKIVVEARYPSSGGGFVKIAERLKFPISEIDSLVEKVESDRDYLQSEELHELIKEDKVFAVRRLLVDETKTVEQLLKEAEDVSFEWKYFTPVDINYLEALVQILQERGAEKQRVDYLIGQIKKLKALKEKDNERR